MVYTTSCLPLLLLVLPFLEPAQGLPAGAGERDSSISALDNVLANTHQSPLYRYPTDFTRGIIPVRKKRYKKKGAK
jgi:hypothetical protein